MTELLPKARLPTCQSLKHLFHPVALTPPVSLAYPGSVTHSWEGCIFILVETIPTHVYTYTSLFYLHNKLELLHVLQKRRLYHLSRATQHGSCLTKYFSRPDTLHSLSHVLRASSSLSCPTVDLNCLLVPGPEASS